MNYGKLTAGTTKTAIDTAKPSEKGEIITYLSRMGDVLEDILEGQEHIVGSLLTVHGVVDGNEPHTECGEHTLKIVPHIDVVTAEAGKILDDNAIDFSCFKVGKHSLEGWAVKICAGITVICIMLGNVQFAA